MLVVRKSPVTRKLKCIELPISERQMDYYETGKYPVKKVFSSLSLENIRFIVYGVSEEEFAQLSNDDREKYTI